MNTKDTDVVHGIDVADAIKSLPFVQERLPLLDVELGTPAPDSIMSRILRLEQYAGVPNQFNEVYREKVRVKAADRTTQALRMLRGLTAEVLSAKAELLSSLEVCAGLDGNVVLKIPNKAAFKAFQEVIKDRTTRIAALEIAITKLDTLGYGFYVDVSKSTGLLESQVTRLKSESDSFMLSGFDSRAEGMKLQSCTAVAIESERTAWDARKTALDAQLVEATQAFKAQKAKLDEMDSILASVGI